MFENYIQKTKNQKQKKTSESGIKITFKILFKFSS